MRLNSLRALAVTALVGVTCVVTIAPAAQAATNPPGIGIATNPTACDQTGTSVIGNPGDTFFVYNLDCGTAFLLAGSYVTGTAATGNGQKGLFTLPSSAGTGALALQTPTGAIRINVTVTLTPVAAPVVTAHDDLQQVGVPASGNCADVDPSVGHYSGAPLGGWSKSWSMWINDGKGGAVCTRELEEAPSGEIILVG